MDLCEQAWDFAVSGLKPPEIGQIMDRQIKAIWTYLWFERKRRGLTSYPFDPYAPTLRGQTWRLAEEGKSRQQIAILMNTTLRRVSQNLHDQRKHLGLASLPDHLRSYPKHHQRLGNIHHPEVNHRQLFKELAQ